MAIIIKRDLCLRFGLQFSFEMKNYCSTAAWSICFFFIFSIDGQHTGSIVCVVCLWFLAARACFSSVMLPFRHAPVPSCSLSVMLTFRHAHVPSCSRSVMFTFRHAPVPSCSRSVMFTFLHITRRGVYVPFPVVLQINVPSKRIISNLYNLLWGMIRTHP